MAICKWVTKSKKPCTHEAIKGNLYCKTHSQYEGIYLPEDIPKLKRCSTCTQLVMPNPETKQCFNCFKKNPIHNCKWLARSGKRCSRTALPGKTCCKIHSEFEDKSITDYAVCSQCKLLYSKTFTKCNRCYPPELICKALNKNGTSCTNIGRSGCLYCGFHARYEGKINPDEFKDLPVCSGCHSYFKPTDGYKRCEECRGQTSIPVSKSKRQICKGITQKGTPCTKQAKEDDEYCGEHQSYKKWKELTEYGISVCSNWIRGCWNYTTDTGFVKCEECRIKERLCDKNIRNERKLLSDSKAGTGELVCIVCGKTKETDNFISEIKHRTVGGESFNILKTCKDCRENMKKQDEKRSDRKREETRKYSERKKTYAFNILQRYSSYKAKDVSKERLQKNEHTIKRKFAYTLMSMPCTYCGDTPTNTSPNGLDRVDNSKGHILGNVVPCCETCNMMKGTRSLRKTIYKSSKLIHTLGHCKSGKGGVECPF